MLHYSAITPPLALPVQMDGSVRRYNRTSALRHARGPWNALLGGRAGLKPGLWDARLVRQIVDGHDVSAQLTEYIAKAQTAVANLPPETRARAQAKLDEAGVNPGSNASCRICVSPAMAASDLPIMDKDDSCRPVLLSRSRKHTTFRVDCTVNGAHTGPR